MTQPTTPPEGAGTATAPDVAPPAATPPASAPDAPLGEPGLKALQAERDARSRAEAEAATLRKQIEDATKTAEQKMADDLKAAQDLATTNATRAMRYEVAAAKGLDLKLATRLAGSTREELEADADTLKALIPAVAPAPPPLTPDPAQGARPGTSETDADADYERYYPKSPTRK